MNGPCYCTMLRTATRKITALYDEALAPVGVNIAQFRMLRIIERQAPVSLSVLGDVLDLDRSTVGRNVRVLDRMGLVETGTGGDRREVVLTLTERAEMVLEKGAPLWEGVQQTIASKLGPDGTAPLKAVIDRL